MLNPSLQKKLSDLHQEGTKIVLATGVFDILHHEHIRFLQKAKELGDFLVVGLESDVRVRKIKGEGRPMFPQEERKDSLRALGIADEVFVLPENFDTPEEHQQLIKEIQPDFFAVSEKTPHLAEKKKILEVSGSKMVVVLKHNPEISSTQILQRRSQKSSRSERNL